MDSTVRWDGGAAYEMRLDASSDAAPAAVYDELADLSTHLDWGGRRQYRGFRLLSLDGSGPMRTGSRFTSVGTVPMALSRWENRNEVVEARAPHVVEFHTDAEVVWRSGKRTVARYEHRYEIVPDGTGSRVSYRLRQTAITDPPLRMRLPVMRTMTHRMMIPMFCRRGFGAMLREAERRQVGDPVPAAGLVPPA